MTTPITPGTPGRIERITKAVKDPKNRKKVAAAGVAGAVILGASAWALTQKGAVPTSEVETNDVTTDPSAVPPGLTGLNQTTPAGIHFQSTNGTINQTVEMASSTPLTIYPKNNPLGALRWADKLQTFPGKSNGTLVNGTYYPLMFGDDIRAMLNNTFRANENSGSTEKPPSVIERIDNYFGNGTGGRMEAWKNTTLDAENTTKNGGVSYKVSMIVSEPFRENDGQRFWQWLNDQPMASSPGRIIPQEGRIRQSVYGPLTLEQTKQAALEDSLSKFAPEEEFTYNLDKSNAILPTLHMAVSGRYTTAMELGNSDRLSVFDGMGLKEYSEGMSCTPIETLKLGLAEGVISRYAPMPGEFADWEHAQYIPLAHVKSAKEQAGLGFNQNDVVVKQSTPLTRTVDYLSGALYNLANIRNYVKAGGI